MSMSTPRVERLSPAIGATVHGLDLTHPIGDALRDELSQLLLEHHVLFFHEQRITPAQQRDLAARFGALHMHPVYPHVGDVPEIIVLDTDAENPPDNDNWHTDVTFIETPPMGAVLSARLLPPAGGDTLWASGIAAYEALSDSLRRFVETLTCEHDFLRSFPAWRFARTPEERVRWEAARDASPPVIHPVIRTHPVTGRRGIFVNEGFSSRILELSPRESEALLRFLTTHVAKPEHTVRWRWRTYDLAFWDNRLTQHYATADYLPHRRVMHRATILGDRPY